MTRSMVSIVLLVGLVVALSIISAFTAVSSANAQLGNTGVPVRCSAYIAVNASTSLTCYASDGTAFPNLTDVPSGRYLMVTDVLLKTLGTATGLWEGGLYRVQGTSLLESLPFATESKSTHAEHFTTPYLVLSQGQHLSFSTSSMNPSGLYIYVSGLLTNSYNYLPMVTRQ